MCDVPRDIQRKFEQRWAARFARPAVAAAPPKHRPKGLTEPLAPRPKAKTNPPVEPTGLRPLPTA